MKPSKDAAEKLRKVRDHILAEPRRFYMGRWIDTADLEAQHPPCGTTACIAGWVALLFSPGDLIEAVALKKLDLEIIDGDKLFYADNWPQRFFTALNRARTCAGRAKVAARRIDYFIRTGK